jgi:predicted O-methyltransferase YrrM
MGGPGNLELLYHLCEHWKAEKVIETGVAYGWSSLALLLSLRHREGARLVSTDLPYAGAGNESYVGCVVAPALREQWTLLSGSDRNGLPTALQKLGGTIDLCHYDSDKSHAGRVWAYPLLWHALRPGGLFISDDIADNLAFKEFADGLGIAPLIAETDGKYVGLLVKPEGGGAC